METYLISGMFPFDRKSTNSCSPQKKMLLKELLDDPNLALIAAQQDKNVELQINVMFSLVVRLLSKKTESRFVRILPPASLD